MALFKTDLVQRDIKLNAGPICASTWKSWAGVQAVLTASELESTEFDQALERLVWQHFAELQMVDEVLDAKAIQALRPTQASSWLSWSTAVARFG